LVRFIGVVSLTFGQSVLRRCSQSIACRLSLVDNERRRQPRKRSMPVATFSGGRGKKPIDLSIREMERKPESPTTSERKSAEKPHI
jgi:hypothetical protein